MSIQKSIDTLITAAIKYTPGTHGGTGGDNAVFGYATEDDVTKQHWPCHSHLRNSPADETVSVYSVWCRANASIVPETVMKAFFDWFNSRTVSPWRSLLNLQTTIECGKNISAGTPDFEWQYGWVFSNLSQMPANLLMNFLVVTRMLKEWPQAILRWYDLVTNEGIDPALAFVSLRSFMVVRNSFMPSLSSGIGTSDSTDGYVVQPTDTGQVIQLANASFYDWPLDTPNAGPDYVLNFCTGNAANPERMFAVGDDGYDHVNNIWGNNTLMDAYHEGTYNHFLYTTYGNILGTLVEGKSKIAKQSDVAKWRMNYSEFIKILKFEQERMQLNACSCAEAA